MFDIRSPRDITSWTCTKAVPDGYEESESDEDGDGGLNSSKLLHVWYRHRCSWRCGMFWNRSSYRALTGDRNVRMASCMAHALSALSYHFRSVGDNFTGTGPLQ